MDDGVFNNIQLPGPRSQLPATSYQLLASSYQFPGREINKFNSTDGYLDNIA
jgi:hypothetical protein